MLSGKPHPLSEHSRRVPFGHGGSCSPSHGPPQGVMIPRMQPRGVQRPCKGPEQAPCILRCPLTLGQSLAVLGVVQRWTQRPTDTHGSGMYGGTER